MDYRKVVEFFVKGILDCLEDCFSTFTVASGKNVLYVFLACVSLLVYTVTMKVFGLYSFLDWQEAMPAVVLTGCLTLMNYGNNKAVVKIKNLLNWKE